MAADTQMDDTRSEIRLDQLARDMGDVKTSVAVILERTLPIQDHETRLRSLESTRSRLWAIWGGAVVLGAAIGWYLAYLTRTH